MLQQLTEEQVRALPAGVSRLYCVHLNPGKYDWEPISSAYEEVEITHTGGRWVIVDAPGAEAVFSVYFQKPPRHESSDQILEDGTLVFESYMTRLYATWGLGVPLERVK